MAKSSLPNNLSIDNLQIAALPLTPRFRDISNQRFGALTVLGYYGSHGGFSSWYCRCSCGVIAIKASSEMMRGKVKSCGTCLLHTRFSTGVKLHYLGATWDGMMARCYRKTNDRFANYGGRGIAVCKQWHKFVNFVKDIDTHLGMKPTPTHTLDRIDNDGNYEPGNVRWATPKQQANNRRCCVSLTFQGITAPLSHWCEVTGMSRFTLVGRIERGWSHEQALTVPLGTRLLVKSLGRRKG